MNVGRGTYGAPTIMPYEGKAQVTIGSYCSIGPDVVILAGGNHRVDWVSTYPFGAFRKGIPGDYTDYHRGNVTVGSDVWIGLGATILMGVTIGHGAVVGARAVVTRDVPPYSVVAGNPARVVRWRFTEAQRESLLRIAWWDWPPDRVERAAELLCQPDPDLLIDAVEAGRT